MLRRSTPGGEAALGFGTDAGCGGTVRSRRNRPSSYTAPHEIGRCGVKHHSHKMSQLNTVPFAMVILPCQALQSISISAWVKFRRNTPGLELSSAHVVNGFPHLPSGGYRNEVTIPPFPHLPSRGYRNEVTVPPFPHLPSASATSFEPIFEFSYEYCTLVRTTVALAKPCRR